MKSRDGVKGSKSHTMESPLLTNKQLCCLGCDHAWMGWSDMLEACLDQDSDELEARLDPTGWLGSKQHGEKRKREGFETAEQTWMQGT